MHKISSIRGLYTNIVSSGFVKNSGIYTVTNIVNGAIPFFLIPILTNNLLPEEYGIMAMFLVLVGFVNPFTGVNVHGAVLRNYFDRDQIDFPKYVFNCLIILIFSTVIVALILSLIADYIQQYTSFPKNWLFAVIIYSFFQFVGLLLLSIWQAQKKALEYGAFVIFRTILDLTSSITLILVLSYGWEGRVIGQLIAVSSLGVFVFIALYRSKLIVFEFDRGYIHDALKFGIPLIPHALALAMFTMSDRIFISNMISVKAVGIYFIAYQIGMVIYLFSDAFNKAWVPWFYEKLKTDLISDKIKIVKITYIYFVSILVLSFIIYLLTPTIFKYFVGAEYAEASNYVIWFLLGFAFNGMYKMVCNYMFYTRKTKIISTITLMAGITNVILNYYFIKIYGIVGAAQASTISFFLSFVLTWIYSNNVYKMPWLKPIIADEADKRQ